MNVVQNEWEMIMRFASLCLLAAVIVSSPIHARSDVVKFDGVQEKCVQVGGIKFGPGTRWPSCQVTRGRWVVTLDFSDMYQAQYCLGKGDGVCEQRAILLFANRAYRPDARLLVQRIDPGETEYDDPVVVQTPYGDVMTIAGRVANGPDTRSYYVWRSERWIPIDASGWQRELAKRLPRGATVAATRVWPDLDTMSARAVLQRADHATGEVMDVQLGLTRDRFVVKKTSLARGD